MPIILALGCPYSSGVQLFCDFRMGHPFLSHPLHLPNELLVTHMGDSAAFLNLEAKLRSAGPVRDRPDSIPGEGPIDDTVRARNENSDLPCRHALNLVFLFEERLVAIEWCCTITGFDSQYG